MLLFPMCPLWSQPPLPIKIRLRDYVKRFQHKRQAVKPVYFYMSGKNSIGYSFLSKTWKHKQKLPKIIKRSNWWLKFHFFAALWYLTSSVSKALRDITGWCIFPSFTAGNVHTAWKLENENKTFFMFWNFGAIDRGNPQVNSKYIIFENRIKSNTPSVNIFVIYLSQVCVRRTIIAISSGPWPFTSGDLQAVWECTNTPPRVKGGHAANYSHVGEGTVPKAAVAQRPKSRFFLTLLPLPIIINELNRNIKLKIKASYDLK